MHNHILIATRAATTLTFASRIMWMSWSPRRTSTCPWTARMSFNRFGTFIGLPCMTQAVRWWRKDISWSQLPEASRFHNLCSQTIPESIIMPARWSYLWLSICQNFEGWTSGHWSNTSWMSCNCSEMMNSGHVAEFERASRAHGMNHNTGLILVTALPPLQESLSAMNIQETEDGWKTHRENCWVRGLDASLKLKSLLDLGDSHLLAAEWEKRQIQASYSYNNDDNLLSWIEII